MAGRHPLVDGGEIEHTCCGVGRREAPTEQFRQFGRELARCQVQAPRGLFGWPVPRVNAEVTCPRVFGPSIS